MTPVSDAPAGGTGMRRGGSVSTMSGVGGERTSFRVGEDEREYRARHTFKHTLDSLSAPAISKFLFEGSEYERQHGGAPPDDVLAFSNVTSGVLSSLNMFTGWQAVVDTPTATRTHAVFKFLRELMITMTDDKNVVNGVSAHHSRGRPHRRARS